MLTDLVLVLNKSWVPISITTVRKALLLTYQETALVVCTKTYLTFDFDSWIGRGLKGSPRCIQTVSLQIPVMEVINLTSYNLIPHRELAFTKRNLFRRDNYTCQYCDRNLKAEDLTIDHVIPKSRGGKTLWENCVAACRRCNKIKGNLLLHETKLNLKDPPHRPRWNFRYILSPNRLKESWKRFLYAKSYE